MAFLDMQCTNVCSLSPWPVSGLLSEMELVNGRPRMDGWKDLSGKAVLS